MLFERPLDAPADGRELVNAYRLYEFRKLYGRDKQALKDLPRLLVDDEAWCGGKCYPWAWAVTRYLQDERHAALAALLRKVATEGGLPRAAAERRAVFDDLFGPLDEKWVERFYEATMKWPLDASALGD